MPSQTIITNQDRKPPSPLHLGTQAYQGGNTAYHSNHHHTVRARDMTRRDQGSPLEHLRGHPQTQQTNQYQHQQDQRLTLTKRHHQTDCK